jgi:hypothetical protein
MGFEMEKGFTRWLACFIKTWGNSILHEDMFTT